MLLQSILLAAAPLLVLARTDLTGCTSSISGPSLIWYVPGTGELCDFLDCGGGRAPPKTTVPGCPGYVGTASYSPSYLPGYGPNAVAAATTTTTAVAASTTASAPTTTSSAALSGSPVAIGSTVTVSSGSAPAVSSGSASKGSSLSSLSSVSRSAVLNGTSTASFLTQSTNAANAVGGSVAALGGILAGAIAML